MARDLAIDLGTANTLVYMKGRGIVLNEPSVIALNRQTGEVLATGREAWQMIGRTPGYIVAVRPLRGGAITDFEITERMIRLLLQRVGVSRFTRPKVVICVPSAITEVERRAVTDAARRAGAADANLIEQPMAAAIGADLPIDEPVGNMVIDIGGGTSETAVISLGGIVALEAVRVGSFDIDAAIQNYVRREHGIAIGERTAEEIKMAIGSADPTPDESHAEVRGRDLMSGLPRVIVLSPEEVALLLAHAPSLKYRAALSIAYGCGLRVSEIANLKVADIDSARMLIRVEQGKGRKDRFAMLSPDLLDLLRQWWRVKRPRGWLFPGQQPVQPITARQLNRACHAAAQAAKLDKRISMHTLRHSFATHLLEHHTDIRVIQVLLGHRKLDSTALYTRVALKTIREVPSPLALLASPPPR